MVFDVEECFLEGVLCFLRRTFRRGRCVLCGFLCLLQFLCIVPLDPLFLQKAGYRVRSCQCRIIMQCLLVKVVGVCLDRCLLCLRRVTPGLCAVMVDSGTDFAFSVGKPAFRQHLALVSGSTPTFSCSTSCTFAWAAWTISWTGRESGLCRRRPLGRFSTSSK